VTGEARFGRSRAQWIITPCTEGARTVAPAPEDQHRPVPFGYPGDLVPEHQRQRNVEHPVLDVHVGVAHTGTGHPHHDLVTGGLGSGQSSSDKRELNRPAAPQHARRDPSDDGRSSFAGCIAGRR